MDEQNSYDYCPFCGYDLLIREEIIIHGIKMLQVGCNECGADIGYEDVE